MTGAAKSTPYHIRMNVQPTQVVSAGQAFKLQYSVSTTSGPWIDVEAATSSSATWRGFDNPTSANNATLGAALLTTSFSNARQTYEEGNPTAPTVNAIGKNKAAEWVWVVQPNGTLANTTYYFRMVWDDGTSLETYTSYPQVTMGNETPDTPASLGPAQFVDNDTGWTTDDTPAVTFSISDANSEQQVRFQVRVATTSTFTALVVDYTSDLQGQGAASFTVGQSGGTYAVGASGMTLADNGTGYWWRVKTVDELAAESAYSDAGAAGTADFRVDGHPAVGRIGTRWDRGGHRLQRRLADHHVG